jgi:hypothetical protein
MDARIANNQSEATSSIINKTQAGNNDLVGQYEKRETCKLYCDLNRNKEYLSSMPTHFVVGEGVVSLTNKTPLNGLALKVSS